MKNSLSTTDNSSDADYKLTVDLKHSAYHFAGGTITPDGKYMISGALSLSKTITLWDTESSTVVRTIKEQSIVLSVLITPDSKYIFSKTVSRNITLWDLESGAKLRTFEGNTSSIFSITITPDGKYLVAGDYEGDIMFWDIKSGAKLRTFKEGDKCIFSLFVTADGKHIVSRDKDNLVAFLDIESGAKIRTLKGHSCFTFTPDGGNIAVGLYDGTIQLLNIEHKTLMQSFEVEGHSSHTVRLVITEDGKHMISGSKDGMLKLWDVQSGDEIHTFQKESSEIISLVITADGKRIVSGDKNGTLKLWDMQSGNEIHTFEEDSCREISLATISNAKHVVLGGSFGNIKMWDMESGREMLQFVVFEDDEWIASTPNGHYNCSYGADKYFTLMPTSK